MIKNEIEGALRGVASRYYSYDDNDLRELAAEVADAIFETLRRQLPQSTANEVIAILSESE